MRGKALHPIPPAAVQAVEALYECGRCIDALKLAETHAPLTDWHGVEAAALASRLAANLGANRLGLQLGVRAWRADRDHLCGRVHYGFQLIEMRGPLAFWLVARSWGPALRGTEEDRADLLALEARVLAEFRDFAPAEQLIEQAERLAPESPWVRLQRALLLEKQDDPTGALEIARSARRLHPHPFHRPSVQTEAHLLQLLNREEEAVELLEQAEACLQAPLLTLQRYRILVELRRWGEAERALDTHRALCPLLDRQGRLWQASQRGRVAYHLGRREEAAGALAELDDPVHRGFAARLREPAREDDRIQMEVPFLRQDFKTCAPATLATLGRYWHMPADHVALAEAICYDGTPPHVQRTWAESHGWIVREFKVTREITSALLQRGVPFALVAVDATSAHMMAVVGFDRVRDAFILRDPSQPHTVDAPAGPFLEAGRAFGPRGTVFLPNCERARLEGLELPDAGLYDVWHEVAQALAKHDRAGATEALAGLTEKWPDHPLTWEVRLEVAAYDENLAEQTLCLDRLLDLFPGNASRQLRRLGCLREAPREERIRFLESACADPKADPRLRIERARVLLQDAREHLRAERDLRRAVRTFPFEASGIAVMGNLCWERGDLEQAKGLYRLAANLEGFREPLFQAWFASCQRTRQAEVALAHLQERFKRFGSRSEQPALTLAWAWREVDQPGRAREVLEEAAIRLPGNGPLLLRTATLNAGLGNWAEADRALEAARGRVNAREFLRTAAEVAELRLDSQEMLRLSRELLQSEPLAMDAHAAVVGCLARLEGDLAAHRHLEVVCASFPHHCGLLRLAVEWSRKAGHDAWIEASRRVLAASPTDAWARRELAWALAARNQLEEARAEAEESLRIEPRNPASHYALGSIHFKGLKFAEARACFRRVVELQVDHIAAIHSLLDLAGADAGRRAELEFVRAELVKQVVSGDGLLTFMDVARPILEGEEILRVLREAHQVRKDLWHAWSALGSQLVHIGRHDEALALLREAVGRFPHLPRIWLDLAGLHRVRGEIGDELVAAGRAHEINPAWNRAIVALTDALERSGRLEEADAAYRTALLHKARDPQLLTCHAMLLWRLRRQEDAFHAISQAVRIAPEHESAWDLMSDWAVRSGQPERTVELARQLTRERSGEAAVWLTLGKVLVGPSTMTERLEAVGRALQLNPRDSGTWDFKAQLLAEAERFDEALAACDEGMTASTGDDFILRGRRAWVAAQRGQVAEAIEEMRKVLAQNSGYVWGWAHLAIWLSAQDLLPEAEAAVEQLLRLRPLDPATHRQLGVVRLKQKNLDGARQAFATGVRLDPMDRNATESLFDLQSEAGDLAGAAATLESMQRHLPGARTLAHEVLLAVALKDRKRALAVFDQVCLDPDPDAWPVDGAAEALCAAKWTRAALRVLKRASAAPSCNPQVGATRVRLLINLKRHWRAVLGFLRLRDPEAQNRAAAVLARGLGAAGCTNLIWFAVRRRPQVFRRSDEAWGQVGYALTRTNKNRLVIRWLSDWRDRSQVEPWMLFNYCLALRESGNLAEAEVVARHVVSRWEHRPGAADLRLFVALEDALAGRTEQAEQHLIGTSVRPDNNYDGALFAIAQSLVAVQQAEPGARRGQFKAERERLGRFFGFTGLLNARRDVRGSFARAGRRFAAMGLGWEATAWSLWKLHWPWLMVPALAALVFLLVGHPGASHFVGPVILALYLLGLRKRK